MERLEESQEGPEALPGGDCGEDRIIEAFVQGVKAKKGIEPKLTHAADHAAGFDLAKAYGEEAGVIVERALDDDFVLSRNCTLRYIASKADTYRGTVSTKHRNGYQATPADGPVWQSGLEGKREP